MSVFFPQAGKQGFKHILECSPPPPLKNHNEIGTYASLPRSPSYIELRDAKEKACGFKIQVFIALHACSHPPYHMATDVIGKPHDFSGLDKAYLLSSVTVPHLPEISFQVMSKCDYRAEPADIWSCGIVLVAMLAGGMKRNSKVDKYRS